VIGRAREAGLRLTPRQFFENPTVAGMAAVLTEHPAQRARVERIAELLAGLEDEEEDQQAREVAL
jgi:hypothetical protein